MSKIRAWAVICLLFLTNMFCLFEWAVAEKGEHSWQQFAIWQDSIIVQLGEELKGQINTNCVEHPI